MAQSALRRIIGNPLETEAQRMAQAFAEGGYKSNGMNPPRNMQQERMDARRARIGMEPYVRQAQTKTAGQAMADMLGGMALATAPIPVVGDLAGAVSDAAMYAAYPEERTMLNAGMSLAGILPFVPGAAGIKTAEKAADALDMSQAAKTISTLPGRNELKWWVDGGQDAVERGFPEEPFILLDKLYIDPQNRGQGIARKVLQEGLNDMATQHPGMDVRLLAEPLDRETNLSDLVRLYESVGFDIDDYQDGMSGVPMSLRLPNPQTKK